jgi:hypothetical protein
MGKSKRNRHSKRPTRLSRSKDITPSVVVDPAEVVEEAPVLTGQEALVGICHLAQALAEAYKLPFFSKNPACQDKLKMASTYALRARATTVERLRWEKKAAAEAKGVLPMDSERLDRALRGVEAGIEAPLWVVGQLANLTRDVSDFAKALQEIYRARTLYFEETSPDQRGNGFMIPALEEILAPAPPAVGLPFEDAPPAGEE